MTYISPFKHLEPAPKQLSQSNKKLSFSGPEINVFTMIIFLYSSSFPDCSTENFRVH